MRVKVRRLNRLTQPLLVALLLVAGATAKPAAAACTYALGGPAAGLTPASSVWSWDAGTAIDEFRATVDDPTYFGSGGTVGVDVTTVNLATVDAASLATVDGFAATWWSDGDSTAAQVNAVVDFFRAGGDLVLWDDDVSHDEIAATLGLPTSASTGTVSNGGPPLFDGPFGLAVNVTQHFAVGRLTPTDVTARGGTVGATNVTGQITSAYWNAGDYINTDGTGCPACGRLVIIADVDTTATQAVPDRYTPPFDDNAIFSLNAVAYLVGCALDATPPELAAALEPLPPTGPSSAASPATACSAPSSKSFQVVCGALDTCDLDPAVRAVLVVTHHDVPADGACVERIERIDIACGDIVELRLLAAACPKRPSNPRPATSATSAGILVIEGEDIVLEVTVTDGCGNEATAIVDPTEAPSTCAEPLPDGTCCPLLEKPDPPNCDVPVCGTPLHARDPGAR